MPSDNPRPADREQGEASERLERWAVVRSDNEPLEPLRQSANDAEKALQLDTAWGYSGLRVVHLVELRDDEYIASIAAAEFGALPPVDPRARRGEQQGIGKGRRHASGLQAPNADAPSNTAPSVAPVAAAPQPDTEPLRVRDTEQFERAMTALVMAVIDHQSSQGHTWNHCVPDCPQGIAARAALLQLFSRSTAPQELEQCNYKAEGREGIWVCRLPKGHKAHHSFVPPHPDSVRLAAVEAALARRSLTINGWHVWRSEEGWNVSADSVTDPITSDGCTFGAAIDAAMQAPNTTPAGGVER